jgi:hypothetical protein
MIIEIKDDSYKDIKCVAMFGDLLCLSSDNTYIELYYHDVSKPYNRGRIHARFGVNDVSSTMLRKLRGMLCTLHVYVRGNPYMTMPCWFVKFENELSGFNKGGYRLEFQEYDKYDAYFYV